MLEVANRATQHLYFVNPIKKWEARASGLMPTHPPIVDRINRLRALTGEGPHGPAGHCARSRASTESVVQYRWSLPRPNRSGRAEIAQLVEHATENRGVASSILALGTTIPPAWRNKREWLSW